MTLLKWWFISLSYYIYTRAVVSLVVFFYWTGLQEVEVPMALAGSSKLIRSILLTFSFTRTIVSWWLQKRPIGKKSLRVSLLQRKDWAWWIVQERRYLDSTWVMRGGETSEWKVLECRCPKISKLWGREAIIIAVECLNEETVCLWAESGTYLWMTLYQSLSFIYSHFIHSVNAAFSTDPTKPIFLLHLKSNLLSCCSRFNIFLILQLFLTIITYSHYYHLRYLFSYLCYRNRLLFLRQWAGKNISMLG